VAKEKKQPGHPAHQNAVFRTVAVALVRDKARVLFK
jgi:hypothetical protein